MSPILHSFLKIICNLGKALISFCSLKECLSHFISLALVAPSCLQQKSSSREQTFNPAIQTPLTSECFGLIPDSGCSCWLQFPPKRTPEAAGGTQALGSLPPAWESWIVFYSLGFDTGQDAVGVKQWIQEGSLPSHPLLSFLLLKEAFQKTYITKKCILGQFSLSIWRILNILSFSLRISQNQSQYHMLHISLKDGGMDLFRVVTTGCKHVLVHGVAHGC